MRHLTLVHLVIAAVLVLMACAVVRAATPADLSFGAAKQFFDTENYKEAANEFERFVGFYGADKRVYMANYLLGRSYRNLNQPDKAMTVLTLVINKATAQDQAPLRAECHFQIAEIYYQQGDYEKAVTSYSNCFQLAQDDVELSVNAIYWMSESKYLLNRLDEAIKGYKRVAETAPKHQLASWSYYSVGRIEYDRGNYNEAIDALTKVKELQAVITENKDDSLLLDATLTLGRAQLKRAATQTDAAKKEADVQAAITAFTTVVKHPAVKDASKQQAQLSLAQAYFDVKDYANAEKTYADVVKTMDPAAQNAMETRLYRGHALYNAKRFKDAAVEYALVAGADRFRDLSLQGAYWQGNALYQVGKAAKDTPAYRDAITAFRKFLDTAGDKHAQAARVSMLAAFSNEDLAGLGDKEAAGQAITLFKQIITKWPATGEATQAHAGIARLTANMSYDDLKGVYGAGLEGYAAWSVALRVAREEFIAGKFDDTIIAAKKVLEGNPTPDVKAQAGYLLAASLQRQGKPAEAIPYYKQVLDAKPADDLVRLAQRGLTQAYLDTKDYTNARANALALTQLQFPDKDQLAESYMYLAEANVGLAQYPDAQTAYQTVVKQYTTSPLVPNALMGLGWVAETKNDTAMAIATYTDLITRFPDRAQLMPEASFRLGVNLAKQKEYAKAVAAFTAVPASHALADQALYGIAWAPRDQGNNDEANASFLKVAEKYPKSTLAADSLYRVGEFWTKQEKYAEALPHLKRAVEIGGADAKTTALIAYKYGVCAFKAGDYPAAAEAFAKVANDAASEFAGDAFFWRAQTLEKLNTEKDAGIARDLYLQYKAKFPAGDLLLDAMLGAGRAANIAKQQTVARDDLQKTLKACEQYDKKPDTILGKRALNVAPEAQYFIGQSYFDEKNWGDALRAYATVSAYNFEPWYSKSMLQMAKCSFNDGDTPAAQRTIQRMINLFANTTPAIVEALKYAADNKMDVVLDAN